MFAAARRLSVEGVQAVAGAGVDVDGVGLAGLEDDGVHPGCALDDADVRERAHTLGERADVPIGEGFNVDVRPKGES